MVAEAAAISGAFSFTCPVSGMEASDPRVSPRGSWGVSDFSRGGHGLPAQVSQENLQRPVTFSNSGEGCSLQVLPGRV